MPNWKKVITSGSDALLNEITASGGIDTTNLDVSELATYNTVEYSNCLFNFEIIDSGTGISVEK